jgi:hypothetical protein
MSLFKRKEKEDIKGTIEIFKKDENGENVLLDTVDILEEKEVDVVTSLKITNDEQPKQLTDSELNDLAFVKELRDTYKDKKDFAKFVKDACASYKPDLSDGKDDDKTIITKLNKEEYNKMLADSLGKDEKGFDRQLEIEKSYQERYNKQKQL